MTQPNKYIHPTLDWIAEYDSEHGYIVRKEGEGVQLRCDEEELLALGFQPVEEEKKSDWIDEAYSEFVLKPGDIRHEDKSKSIFREAIEKYVPKQELIPLDTDKVTEELMEGLFWEWQKDGSIGKIIKQIFSKYGTTPQKKFTRLEIEKVVGKYEKDSWDDYQAGKLKGAEEILIHMGLLEE